MLANPRLRYSLLLALLSGAFFISFNGGVHLFDWDEINFAEISREMLITREYTRVYVNFVPFWEKPPFFFWLQAGAMALFGVNEFAARFPNAICGIVTILLLFNLGARMYSIRFGLLWAGMYMGFILPFLYFKSGIIDPWFNLFIFLGIYYFILFYWKKERFRGISLKYPALVYLFLGGFFIGMGILTKGPVAYLIAALTFFAYWVYQRFRFYVNVPQFLFFTLAALLVMLTWFGLETWKNGPWFVQEFTRYQYRLFSTPDAGHRGFPGYHFAVLLLGVFPASLFALRAFFRMPPEAHDHLRDFRSWMKFLFWVVLILFTIVQSKIVHYSSMCYFPLTYLAVLVAEKIIRGELPMARWMKGVLVGLGLVYALLIVALPFVGQHIELLVPLFKNDPFAQANLEADVRWTGLEALPGLLLAGLLLGSLWLFNRQRFIRGFQLLLGGIPVFIMLSLYFFIGRIETYSQRAAVEFFEDKAGRDVHLMTYGYRSYVHLFYGRPLQAGRACFEEEGCHQHLLEGDIDRPVYLSTKTHRAAPLRQMEGLEEIGERNGFVFFRRMPRN
jgi:hypothetical protein